MNEPRPRPYIPISYHESLLERAGRAHISDCPKVYAADTRLIEATNRGERVPEALALSEYFGRLRTGDAEYMTQIDRIVAEREQKFPDSVRGMGDRRLQ